MKIRVPFPGLLSRCNPIYLEIVKKFEYPRHNSFKGTSNALFPIKYHIYFLMLRLIYLKLSVPYVETSCVFFCMKNIINAEMWA